MELNDGLNANSKRNSFKPISKLMLILYRNAHGSHMSKWCNQCHAAFKNNIPIDIAFSIILSFHNIEIACPWNSNGVVYALQRNSFKPISKLMLILYRNAHGSHRSKWCNQCHAAFKNNISIDIALSIILSFHNIEIACPWNSNGVVYALHRGPYLPQARISSTCVMWELRQDRKCKHVLQSQHWAGAVTWNPSS